VKGDVELLLAPRKPQFVAAQHPAMHPGRCAAVLLDGVNIGFVGELHPKWRQGYELPSAPVLFELDLDAVQQRVVPQAQPVPRLQTVLRDLALVVADTVSHDALMNALKADEAGLIRSATLFDIYRPKEPTADIHAGERSLAVRLELHDDAAALTEERIEATMAAAVARVSAQLAARLRA